MVVGVIGILFIEDPNIIGFLVDPQDIEDVYGIDNFVEILECYYGFFVGSWFYAVIGYILYEFLAGFYVL